MTYKTYEVTVGNDGSQSWRLNGKLHREDGPAYIEADGSQLWCINDERHREDGPAYIDKSGYKAWYQNDKLHREDGPAIIGSSGFKKWWVNGNQLTEEEFNNRNNSGAGKIVEIDGKKYKLTEV